MIETKIKTGIEYTVVTGNIDSFATRLNRHIQEGWYIQGNSNMTCVVKESTLYYSQLLWRSV